MFFHKTLPTVEGIVFLVGVGVSKAPLLYAAIFHLFGP